MKVLSLFDGIACGRLALERAGIPIERYYSSEIDKYAIAVGKKNFPEIVSLGDVRGWRNWDLDVGSIDLLLGGSPCQGFSFAGKHLNFEDERSRLFFEYVDILNEIRSKNPNVYFILENVRMKKEYQDVISDRLGVYPIEIDSALVSAQHRKRLYWTNIPNVGLPEDRGVFLKDIVHEWADMITGVSKGWVNWFEKRAGKLLYKKYVSISPEKSLTMTTRQYTSWQGTYLFEWLEKYIVPFEKTKIILEQEVQRRKISCFHVGGTQHIYYIHNKEVLVGEEYGTTEDAKKYLFGCITPDWVNKGQNGQRFNEGEKFYTLVSKSQHGILTEGYLRRLTPIECERLQTLPDEYTWAEMNGKKISDAQRYKMLGNGWTVDVIVHILSYLGVERC